MRSRILCRHKNCNYPSRKFWHSPVCLNCESEKGCVYGDKCRFRYVEEDVKPNKKSKKRWCERNQLLYWRSLHNWAVYLKILIRVNLFYVNLECWDQNTPSNSPKAPGTKSNFGKERVHRESEPCTLTTVEVLVTQGFSNFSLCTRDFCTYVSQIGVRLAL